MRILVADDDKVISTLICATLRRAGHSPIPAYDSMQALMFAMRSPLPDAIVLDLNMPGGGGFETLKKLKLSARTAEIPVLVISGELNPSAPATATDLGAAAFLPKPVVPEAMLEELNRVLSAAVR